ncbi:TerC family protein [Alkalibacillus salilacus]|uniref:YjbE family integral membrane protein n=1 Tax=Alkalibacillus salilacus TaxID=284582 RepID=A0ABT9VH58_9BACI|nr:TerC family protein [Alkalibacillus salilacus]MDQ0160291.1 YjbE family integral membrane protein [Alkalibacillus salilacus]
MEFLLELNWDIIKALFIIIGIDLILGGDNAIVIAMASRKLPDHLQQKAIVFGTILAIAFRFILATIAIFLLTMPYVQLIGGLLLFYIATQLLRDQDAHDHPDIQSSTTFLGAVKTIIIADVVMGFDNVLAISAAANQNIALILFGLIISVPLIIFGSQIILKLMKRYPFMIYLGASLLAYTSAELILKEEKIEAVWTSIPYHALTWPLFMVILVLFIGYLSRKPAV